MFLNFYVAFILYHQHTTIFQRRKDDKDKQAQQRKFNSVKETTTLFPS